MLIVVAEWRISPKELLGLTPTFRLNDERIWGLLNRLNLFRAFLFPYKREVNLETYGEKVTCSQHIGDHA